MAWLGLALRNGMIAAVGLLLPLVMACAMMLVITPTRQSSDAPNPVRTPNPTPAPRYAFGPADFLVYRDPSYAGTIGYWLAIWYAIGSLYCVVAAITPLFKAPLLKNGWAVFVVAVLLGFLAAFPWWYSIAFGSAT